MLEPSMYPRLSNLPTLSARSEDMNSKSTPAPTPASMGSQRPFSCLLPPIHQLTNVGEQQQFNTNGEDSIITAAEAAGQEKARSMDLQEVEAKNPRQIACNPVRCFDPIPRSQRVQRDPTSGTYQYVDKDTMWRSTTNGDIDNDYRHWTTKGPQNLASQTQPSPSPRQPLGFFPLTASMQYDRLAPVDGPLYKSTKAEQLHRPLSASDSASSWSSSTSLSSPDPSHSPHAPTYRAAIFEDSLSLYSAPRLLTAPSSSLRATSPQIQPTASRSSSRNSSQSQVKAPHTTAQANNDQTRTPILESTVATAPHQNQIPNLHSSSDYSATAANNAVSQPVAISVRQSVSIDLRATITVGDIGSYVIKLDENRSVETQLLDIEFCARYAIDQGLSIDRAGEWVQKQIDFLAARKIQTNMRKRLAEGSVGGSAQKVQRTKSD